MNGFKATSKKTHTDDDGKAGEKEVEMSIVNGNDDKHAIRMTNVFAKWSENAGDDSLSDVNIDVEKGRLLAVIGPVGAGKVGSLTSGF